MKARLVLMQECCLVECKEFCHLFSSLVENLNLEHSKHVISIREAVKTLRHVTVRQTGVIVAPVSMWHLDTLLSPTQVNKGKSLIVM